MPRRIKTGPLFPRRGGLYVRTAASGLLFLYLDEQKICRYHPDRQALEFQDHGKGGRVIEASIGEFTEGLIRLTEAVELPS